VALKFHLVTEGKNMGASAGILVKLLGIFYVAMDTLGSRLWCIIITALILCVCVCVVK